MKILAHFVLCWATFSSAASIKRDPQGTDPSSWLSSQVSQMMGNQVKVMQQLAPNIKPFSTSKSAAKIRPDATKKVLRFGPNVIPTSKAELGGMHMGHSSPGGVTSSNWEDWTIGQAIGKLTGGPPALGMPLVTLGQLRKVITGWMSGDWIGPMRDMMATAQDPNGWTHYRTFQAAEICAECTVLSVKANLVYENGTRADISNGLYLHHHASLNMGLHMSVNWINQCPNEQITVAGVNLGSYVPREMPIPQILALATVEEYTNYFTAKNGNLKSGLQIKGDDVVFMMTEVVNYAKHEQRVFIQLDVEYIDGKAEQESTYTSLSFTGMCNPAWGFNGNGGVGNITSNAFEVNYPGTIVNARGHMHDGGTSLDILVNNKTACSSEAVYGTRLKMNDKEWTTISQMTDCTKPFTVKKGDQVRLVVNYDEIAHPKRESGGEEQEEMGFMYFTFIPL